MKTLLKALAILGVILITLIVALLSLTILNELPIIFEGILYPMPAAIMLAITLILYLIMLIIGALMSWYTLISKVFNKTKSNNGNQTNIRKYDI